MFVIVPLCDVPSREKSDRLLNLISDVASFTWEKELDCLSYGWFRSAGDTDSVPHHWIRGLEVYKFPEANRKIHRAGKAYQAFREGAVAEALLNGYPDVRFWSPIAGFMTRAPVDFESKSQRASPWYIGIQDLVPRNGSRSRLLEVLRSVAKVAETSPGVESFWVLERSDKEDGDDLILFSAFVSKAKFDTFVFSEQAAAWTVVRELCQTCTTTTWLGSQIGFVGR